MMLLSTAMKMRLRFAAFQPAEVRARRENGSLLIVAVVVVAVASSLAVAAGFAVRAHVRANAEIQRCRDGMHHAEAACVRAIFDRVATDTNGYDSLDEPWAREPWEVQTEGWWYRVSGTGWQRDADKTIGMIDAERLVPINTCAPDLLRELLVRVAECDEAVASVSATMIVDWREKRRAAILERSDPAWTNAPPFSCVGELNFVPSLPDGVVRALSPLVTVQGAGKINLNTAPIAIIECLLASVDEGDVAAALRLRDRISSFRDAGGIFASPDAVTLARSLGGIPPDESAVLARASELACVASTEFHGIAEVQSEVDRQSGRAAFRREFSWTRPGVESGEVDQNSVP